MDNIGRRTVLSGGLVGAAGLVAGCNDRRAPLRVQRAPTSTAKPTPTRSARPIGDGSTSDTGPQPHQPRARRLKPGEKPPQFVVISWDGGGESSLKLNSHFQKVAAKHRASMTYFVTGLYFLPESKKTLYRPPHRKPGASDIGYFPDRFIHSTIEQIGRAWLGGHEIATHFNGHFCGPRGVASWSVGDWKSEIEQAKRFVREWRTNTGFTDLPALPFDYDKELIGGRAPCLEGADNLRKAAADLGWRYDSSSTRYPTWPEKVDGIWDLSLQSIPFPATGRGVLAMDYNFLANQSEVVNGDPAQRPTWQRQTVEAFMAGFRRSYDGNRSPLVIGNHFENWNGGIYMRAVEDVMAQMAAEPDTRFVSFRQLCDWLDAQDPAVLATLHRLGGAPADGWASVVT